MFIFEEIKERFSSKKRIKALENEVRAAKVAVDLNERLKRLGDFSLEIDYQINDNAYFVRIFANNSGFKRIILANTDVDISGIYSVVDFFEHGITYGKLNCDCKKPKKK